MCASDRQPTSDIHMSVIATINQQLAYSCVGRLHAEFHNESARISRTDFCFVVDFVSVRSLETFRPVHLASGLNLYTEFRQKHQRCRNRLYMLLVKWLTVDCNLFFRAETKGVQQFDCSGLEIWLLPQVSKCIRFSHAMHPNTPCRTSDLRVLSRCTHNCAWICL